MQRDFFGRDGMGIMRWLTGLLPSLKPGKQYRLIVKAVTKPRSKDANAYAWVLLTKMADHLTAEAQGDVAYTKDEVYFEMLKSYGQGGIVKVQAKDSERFMRSHKYCEVHETLSGEGAVYFRFWIGSSEYSVHEMSLFINGIVAECKGINIETEPPQRLEAMLEAWGQKSANHGQGP